MVLKALSHDKRRGYTQIGRVMIFAIGEPETDNLGSARTDS